MDGYKNEIAYIYAQREIAEKSLLKEIFKNKVNIHRTKPLCKDVTFKPIRRNDNKNRRGSQGS